MYRCAHCRNLHLTSRQARTCSRYDHECLDDVLAEVERILDRGPIRWEVRPALRDEHDWTWPERLLLKALRDAVSPDSIRTRFWIPGSDYRVDILVDPIDLVVEVDRPSFGGRVGADRLRSSVIRSHGYQILRVPHELASSDSEAVAAIVAHRLEQEREAKAPLAVSA